MGTMCPTSLTAPQCACGPTEAPWSPAFSLKCLPHGNVPVKSLFALAWVGQSLHFCQDKKYQ